MTTTIAETPAPGRCRRGEQTEAIVEQLRTCGADDIDELKHRLVLTNLAMAEAIAARYVGRGVAWDDLCQVAYLALVKAVDKFDPTAGFSFFAYGVPTVRGEIRRYFRDQGWMVRPPRRIQEMQRRVNLAVSELAGGSGRQPSQAEVATHLDESLDDVREAMEGRSAFHPASLDRPPGDDSPTPLGELIGADDPAQNAAEARVLLEPVLRRLRPRDQRILLLRFFEDLTQQEIADDIGVTQMQVSRILSRIFSDIRRSLDDPFQAEIG